MKRPTVTLLTTALLMLPFISFGQAKTHSVTLLNDKVQLTVPDQLQPISDQQWQQQYPNHPKTPLALSNPDAGIMLMAEPTQQPAGEDEMAAYALFQFQELKKNHPNARYGEHPHGTTIVNNKKIGWLKFVTPSGNGTTFNYYFFASVGGKILSFVFNCPGSKQKTGEPVAETILRSIKVN
jgi:hypothetical protein